MLFHFYLTTQLSAKFLIDCCICYIRLDSTSVIFMNARLLLEDKPKIFNKLIENVQDFHIKKDYMFATRRVPNNTQLFISYRRGPFIKADFQTELEIKVMESKIRILFIGHSFELFVEIYNNFGIISPGFAYC